MSLSHCIQIYENFVVAPVVVVLAAVVIIVVDFCGSNNNNAPNNIYREIQMLFYTGQHINNMYM